MPEIKARANLRTIAIRASSLKDAGDEPILVLNLQIPLSEVDGAPVSQLVGRVKKDVDLTFQWFSMGDQRHMGETAGASWCDYPKPGVCHEHPAKDNIGAYWHCKDKPHQSLNDPCEHIKTDTEPNEHAPAAEAPSRRRGRRAAAPVESDVPAAATGEAEPEIERGHADDVPAEAVCHQEGTLWWCAVAAAFNAGPCKHVGDALSDAQPEGQPAADNGTVVEDYAAQDAAASAARDAARAERENAGVVEIDGCSWIPYAQKGHCKNDPVGTQQAPCEHIEAMWRRLDKAEAAMTREPALVGATTDPAGSGEVPF